MEIEFNGIDVPIDSLEQLGVVLKNFDRTTEFELWISAGSFPSMCMLRNGEHAWLMYMRSEDDSVHSIGEYGGNESCRFSLSNGQLDEYPLSWCIDVEQCYKVITYFYVNEGAIPAWVKWS